MGEIKPTRRELIEAIDNYTTAIIDYNNAQRSKWLVEGYQSNTSYEDREIEKTMASKNHRWEYILFFLDMLDIK